MKHHVTPRAIVHWAAQVAGNTAIDAQYRCVTKCKRNNYRFRETFDRSANRDDDIAMFNVPLSIKAPIAISRTVTPILPTRSKLNNACPTGPDAFGPRLHQTAYDVTPTISKETTVKNHLVKHMPEPNPSCHKQNTSR